MQILFYILFFFTPLIFLPITSELFEFNKMIFVYIITVLIMAAWLSKCIAAKKFVFRRTPLDVPLLIFLGSQLLSTIFSIDPRTSLLGYYSRFNGGLASTLCYSLLYWAFVSNTDKKSALRTLYFALTSTVIVSILAVLEHFGINTTCKLMGQGWGSCWVQDVQNRVFSTLGQPNWLATFLVALIPVSLAFSLKLKPKNFKFWLYSASAFLFFITLLFTKSRSGLLGFTVADITFWSYLLFKYRKRFLKEFLFFNVLFLIIFLVVKLPTASQPPPVTSNAPALETGGTESGIIRKIVWKGAINIWRNYPIFGSGVETFAYSYYQFRPVEHNLVSEWDFLYNKAHNEYLNLAATTGTLGLFSYLYLIAVMVLVFVRNLDLFSLSLMSGFISLLICNFFGFSVVTTQLQLFLFPAFAITLGVSGQGIGNRPKTKLNNTQKTFVVLSLFAMTYSLYAISRYWSADALYAKGKANNDSGNYAVSQNFLKEAVTLSPGEAIFHNELANSYTGIALALQSSRETENLDQFINLAISESERAISLSPANVNLLRSRANLFLKLSMVNPKYLGGAKDALSTATAKAPTDAKLFYNLALTYVRTGKIETSVAILQKTIDLKPNYKDARYLYALILIDKNQNQEAKRELNYILEKIDPGDTNSQNLLKKIQ